eukprot:TRINITY_DN3438_c0_g1_i10.p3 TRINITY_DN3438_c0_g1~~TRINITY_DN3438_c0_g1_i10.p3  ORF type:complete len:124 (+),score=57.40 TRINITY_DN3438_c0_g1_i10:122-493(+)
MEKRSKHKKAAKKPEGKKESEEPIPRCILSKGEKVLLTVEAKPGSKSDEIYELCEEFVGVAVQAEAKGGEANANIVKFLAEVLGVKKTSVSIDKGNKSKSKLIEIEGISAQEVYKRLSSYMQK